MSVKSTFVAHDACAGESVIVMYDIDMQKAVEYIYDIPKINRKSTPDNTKEMLGRLGAECSDIPVIHVAGTNGKGSVCSYIESVLRHAGFETGLFTSPHLVTVNERIAINGVPVSDEELLDAFARVKDISAGMVKDGFVHPSFFEFLFGMGMCVFAEKRPDYIILETGLGGRLDATNVVEKPAVTVITSIGLDHTDILGDTYEQIASEKAGIIKERVPVVFENKRPDVTSVIERKAFEKNAPLYVLNPEDIRDVTYRDKKIDFLLDNQYYSNMRVTLDTMASYQTENAALALLALKVLGVGDEEAIRAGLYDMKWTGRMEEVIPGVIVDGAHNDDGIEHFIQSVSMYRSDGERILLFSAVKDKHYQGMIKSLCECRLFDMVVIGQLGDARGLDAETMRKCFEDNGMSNVTACDSVKEAYEYAVGMKGDGTVFAAGSLYFAGELLEVIRGGLR